MVAQKKQACLIYVNETETMVGEACTRLEAAGYTVCAVKASLEIVAAAEANSAALPKDLADCISQSELCIFLVPEQQDADGLLGAAAGEAGRLSKQMVGIIAGGRATSPSGLDDHAQAIIRQNSSSLDAAISGEEIRETPAAARAHERSFVTVKCQ